MNDLSFDGVADAVPVTLRPSMFSMHRETHLMPPGYSIAQMLAMYPGGVPDGFDSFGVVRINGIVVPRHLWHLVKIKRGPEPKMITLHMLPGDPGGGGSGTKNALMIVGAIAVMAATAWVGGGALIPFLAPGLVTALGGAAVVNAVAAGIVGVAGTLALYSLAPPPINPRDRSTGGGQTAVMVGIQGNVLAPLQTIPTVLGKIMASPPHLIRPYTKMVDNKLTGYACVGFSGFLDITDVRINGMPETDFEGVTTHVVENGAAQTIATENCWEDFPNVRLSKHQVLQDDDAGRELVDQATPANSCPQYHYFRSKGIPSKIRIRLLFPVGHYYTNSSGNSREAETWLRIEVRKAGDVTWLKLPTLIYAGEYKGELRSQITLSWGTSDASSVGNAGGQLFHNGASSTTGLGETWEYDSHSNFKFAADPNTTAKNITRDGEQGWTIHLATAQFPQTGEYEVRIKRSSTRLEADVTGTITDDMFGSENEGGVDKVFGSDSNADQNRAASEIIVESFATVRAGAPLVEDDLSYIEVEAIELQIQTISATWQTKAGDWDNDPGDKVWRAQESLVSSNVAALYRYVATLSRLNAEPLDATLLEDDTNGDSLVDWWIAANAASPDLACNMIVDGMPVEQVLQIIAACGYAAVRRSDRWGVVYERDRSADTPIQMFSPRNTWNNSIKKIFPDPPIDGLFVTYPDESDDYGVNEITEKDGATGDNVEAIEYPGITHATNIERRATLDLRQRRLRTRFYSFMTDLQALVVQRGDLVGYTYDAIDNARFSARINELVPNGTAASGVILDTAIKLNDLKVLGNVGMVILRNDGTVVAKQIDTTGVTAATPEQTLFDFTSDIAGAIAITSDFVGAHVMIGTLNSEYRRCLVFDITWDQDLNANMILVDEAPGIHPL